MKKLILIGCIILFSGCSGIYKMGKTVVITNSDLLDKETLLKLERIDNAREALRNAK